MSTHNREWDHGKDSYDYEQQQRWRDDYGGGDKRRKFNNGGYEYGGSQEESYSGQYGDSQSGFGGHGEFNDDRRQRKRLVPSEPSQHVIFLGLDPDFTENDLHSYLTESGFTLDNVTIIRERSTGASKGFGFAQFSSTEQAQKFVDPNFPFIQIPPPASHGASARKAFVAALQSGAQHTGRRVKIDYSQSANPPGGRGPRGPLHGNDGTRDIGTQPHAVILIRGLDAMASANNIALAVKTSLGPGKDGSKTLRRVLVMKDRITSINWGFAFLEFVDTQAASEFLSATLSSQVHPSGFRIVDRPVAVSFAHQYSFQPLPDNILQDNSCIKSSLALGGVEDQWVKYWDENAAVTELLFDVEMPVRPVGLGPAEKKKERRIKDTKTSAAISEPVAPSELPLSDKPLTLNFKGSGPVKTPTGPVKVKSSAQTNLGFNVPDDPGAANDDDEEVLNARDAAQAKAPKVVVPHMMASKNVAGNISKWTKMQDELHHETGGIAKNPAQPQIELFSVENQTKDGQELQYGDTKALTCLLCQRQFKTLDVLRRHSKESELHKKNAQDPKLCETARQRAATNRGPGFKPVGSAETATYRDRAMERRKVHNQPDAPIPEGISGTKRKAEAPPKPPTPPATPVNPGQDSNNMGNKLLRMMGWSIGTGLGQNGEGRVDPIKTAIYAEGAGLGASKGSEVGKYQTGYAGYLDKARDSARDRYDGS